MKDEKKKMKEGICLLFRFFSFLFPLSSPKGDGNRGVREKNKNKREKKQPKFFPLSSFLFPLSSPKGDGNRGEK